MTVPQERSVPRQRGRGWLLSFAAVMTWEAVLVVITTIAGGGLPSGDDLYWRISPMLAITAVFATPLTYLVAWRRPRSYPSMLLWALPVFLVALAIATRSG